MSHTHACIQQLLTGGMVSADFSKGLCIYTLEPLNISTVLHWWQIGNVEEAASVGHINVFTFTSLLSKKLSKKQFFDEFFCQFITRLFTNYFPANKAVYMETETGEVAFEGWPLKEVSAIGRS